MVEKSSKFLKVLLFALCSLHFASQKLLAIELDTSIDDEIRKKYNPSKLEQDMSLPALPKILLQSQSYHNVNSTNTVAKPSTPANAGLQHAVSYSKAEQSVIRLKKGTKIRLKLLSSVSDSTHKGTKLSFSSVSLVKNKHYTIPEGTLFSGYVVNSHKPQLSGNGGLIVININSMILNDEVQPINARVVKANGKHIFRNNIKGKRKYMSSMLHCTKPGARFGKKMFNIAQRHASSEFGLIITPLSMASGTLVWGGSILVSPALALFHKGGNIALREGTEVDVKLMQDIFVYL